MTGLPADEDRTLTEVRAHVLALANSQNVYREEARAVAAEFSEYAKHNDRAVDALTVFVTALVTRIEALEAAR